MGVAEGHNQSNTPVSIEVRKFDPQATQACAEYFFDNDAFKTHFMNALSILFPEGERFFIRSVLAYRDRISDPKLLREIKDFCAQEAQHTLVHEAMNDLAARHGYPVAKLESLVRRDLRRFSNRGKKSPRARRAALAMTVCMEHFTAILAFQVLTNVEDTWQGLDPAVQALFKWHALEETEHKGVAFDVYQATGGSPLFLRIAMLFSTFFFLLGLFVNLTVLLYKDGSIRKWSTWKTGVQFMFGPKQGFLVRPFRDWLAFFKPGFHPWKQHMDLDTQPTVAGIGAYIA
jgi:predicted metal-dependent hydrolase